MLIWPKIMLVHSQFAGYIATPPEPIIFVIIFFYYTLGSLQTSDIKLIFFLSTLLSLRYHLKAQEIIREFIHL